MVNNILPFIEKAPRIKVHPNIKISVSSIITDGFTTLASNTKNLVYLVRPLGLLVAFRPNVIDDQVVCDLIEVDYNYVADLITIQDNKALFPEFGGFDEEEIETPEFINKASNKVRMQDVGIKNGKVYIVPLEDKVKLVESVYEEKFPIMNEASLASLKAKKANVPITTNEQSAIDIRLESYLKGGYLTQRVLMLIGHSAVAKSARVKAIADKLGFRMIDLRTAFMSRLDLQGLTEIVYNSDGTVNSTQAPMQDIITCTDEYIKFCRAAIPEIEKAYNEEENAEVKKNIKRTLDNFRECAKPPILFLDEVNRTEASVRQVLTNILSSKTFMGHKMSMARIVSAANFAIGSSEELQDVFQTNNTTDSAFNDRFEAIPITPQDVLPSWLSWAKSQKDGRQNIHQCILDFLEKNDQFYYFYDDVEKQYLEDYDQDNLSTSPYPNFRTWDLLSQYIYECQELKRPVQFTTVYGFVGQKAAKLVKPYIEKHLQVVQEDKEDWDTIVEDALIARTPTLLVSPSGVGKSARINSVSKKLGNLVIEVNLAELDRSDVMGAPAKVSTVDHIAGQFGNTDALSAKLKDISKGFALPEYVTVKAPRLDVARKFQDAVATGRKVTLLFEEVNRVTNPMIMSAVFEAISDHRIFGINFDPSQVSVIAACNMGEGFQDVQSLDSAFAARFNIHRKHNYSEDDCESIRKFVKEKYSPALEGYISNLSDEDLIQMVSSVETREIHQSVSSTRALYDLDLFLRDTSTTSLNKGAVIYKEPAQRRALGRIDTATSYKDGVIQNQIADIQKSIANWCALDTEITINLGDEQATPRELKQMFEECKDLLDNGDSSYLEVMITLIKAIAEVDQSAVNAREKAISFIVGDDTAKEFCRYYNKVSGTALSRIEIKDLRDMSLFGDYLQQLTTASRTIQPAALRTRLVQVFREIFNEFNTTLSVAHYRHFFTTAMDFLNTSDSRLQLLQALVADSNVDSLLAFAESQDANFVSDLITKAGIPVDKNKLASLVHPGTKTVGKVYKTRFI